MQLQVVTATLKEKPLLSKMLFKYQQELLKNENPGEYKYLDLYWEKDNRFPLLIKINNDIVGFTLVNQHTLVENSTYNIAEFYIKPENRLKGYGKKVAFKIFNLFPGAWEIRILDENEMAISFWQRVVKEYTNNLFECISGKKYGWEGPIITFTSKK